MQSKNTSPPISNANTTIPQTNLPTSSAPHLPPVTHLASPSTHSPTVPNPVQQQLDHIQLSTNMKIESLATTFAQRFDQLFALFHSSPSSHTLTPHLSMPLPSTLSPSLTLPPHTLPHTPHLRHTVGPFTRTPLLTFNPSDHATPRGPQLRLDAPKFDGLDPAGWIFLIEEYFQFHSIAHADRLRLVGLFFEGQASEWFRWMQGNSSLHSWEDFLQQVRLRFDPDHFEDYVGALSKLRQSTTVLAYQSEFEHLLNKITGVSEPTLISVFISGLKPHLRHEINLRRPSSLTVAFALVRELSALHVDASSTQQPATSALPVSTTSTEPPLSTAAPPPTHSGNNIRRITAAEKMAKDAQGLCYWCDQK